MEFNRNHYFMAGVVFLLLGIQLRFVESYTLNESTTQALGSYFAASEQPSAQARFMAAAGPPPRKTVHPPQWLGWALMSAGSVLILHSLAMTKPSG